MFDVNQDRYVKKVVHEVIPLELQQFLWLIIDCQKAAGDRLDYLQVSELIPDEEYQLVCNKQEYPLVQLDYKFQLNLNEPISCTLWVIDSKEYATMLLLSEY